MKTFKIHLSAEGTKDQIEMSLRTMARNIQDTSENELDDTEWEDSVMFAEVNEL